MTPLEAQRHAYKIARLKKQERHAWAVARHAAKKQRQAETAWAVASARWQKWRDRLEDAKQGVER